LQVVVRVPLPKQPHSFVVHSAFAAQAVPTAFAVAVHVRDQLASGRHCRFAPS
jgi:hypothetical protein